MHFFLGNRKLVKADEESAATGLEGLADAVDEGLDRDSVKDVLINGGASITIEGDLTVGSELTAVLPSTLGATSYQWMRGGVDISGATSSTYALTSTDAGEDITVKATGVYVISTGVSVGDISRLLIAATNQRSSGSSIATNYTNIRGRVPFQTGSGTLSSLAVGLSTVGNGNSGDFAFGGFTVVEAYIEDDTTGQLTPITSDGSSTFSVDSDIVKFICDEISASDLGYPDGIPIGTKFWYRYDCTSAVGDTFPASYFLGQVEESAGWFWNPDDGGVVDPVNATGPIEKTGSVFGGGESEAHAPIIFGRFVEDDVTVALTMGDSLSWGTAATRVDAGWAGFGVPQRSLYSDPVALSDPIAGLTIARSGNTSDDLSGSNVRMWDYFENATRGYEALGTNDIGVLGASEDSSVYTGILARKRTIWEGMRAAGFDKVATMMYLPNTSSTDDYTTLENQTAQTGWGDGEIADQFRDTILAEEGRSDGVDLCIQYNSVRWSETDQWAWVSEPDNDYHWGDDLQSLASVELRSFWESE